jgi:hypothetical protein
MMSLSPDLVDFYDAQLFWEGIIFALIPNVIHMLSQIRTHFT